MICGVTENGKHWENWMTEAIQSKERKKKKRNTLAIMTGMLVSDPLTPPSASIARRCIVSPWFRRHRLVVNFEI